MAFDESNSENVAVGDNSFGVKVCFCRLPFDLASTMFTKIIGYDLQLIYDTENTKYIKVFNNKRNLAVSEML